MVRLCDELRVLAAALIISLALVLGLGSAAVGGIPGTFGEHPGIASVDHASSPHAPCTQDSSGHRVDDCCSGIAHCGGAGGSAFVVPAEAPGFVDSARRAWALAPAQCLRGLDPSVNRHPPRDFG